MEYYDEYISLGGNCEIGFQFRRYGKEPSSLFSWLVSDIDKITNTLEKNFQDFYEFEDLIPYAHDMVKSTKSGFSFHSRMHSKYNSKIKKMEFIHSIDKRREFFEKEKSKYNYLIEKWNNLSRSELKVVYFIKDMLNYDDKRIIRLEQVIKNKFPKHNFKIVVVREGKRLPKESLTSNADICYVNFFSDKKHPAVQIIDLDAWDKIYALYPLKNALPENLKWIKEQCNFTKKENYSLALNYNLAQFYAKLGFLENAIYFLKQARKQSNEKFIEDAYIKVLHAYKNKNDLLENMKKKHIDKLYSMEKEEDILNYISDYNLVHWKYNNEPLEISVYQEARYIRLSLQEFICLHLDEIEIWNIKDENVALNKSLIMSSTYNLKNPILNKKAMNGIISGVPSFHTKTERNPWVVLDLENYEQIKCIKIYNRKGKYSTRAISLLIEVSNNLRDWITIHDNYAFQKKLDINLLSRDKQDIFNNIFNGKIPFLKRNTDVKNLLNTLFKSSLNPNTSKFIKYALMLKVKSYYQIKIEVKKASNQKNELQILNDAVKLVYGENFIFTLKNSLIKGVEGSRNTSFGFEKELNIIFNRMDTYSKDSEEYTFILYLILCKYKATARLNGELKKSKNKLLTSQLIQKSIDFLYGNGYIFTQHGINKNLSKQFSQDNIQNILDEINSLSNLLKEKFEVEHYIDSGTMLGAVRNGKFIEHDDDLDTAYISKENNYINIWAESLMIRNYLNTFDKYNISSRMPGLFHLKVTGKVKFKVDIFIGWFEDIDYFKFPSKPSTLTKKDMLPLKKINLHGKSLNIPNDYEKVLEHMYGEGWRIPDPSYRCVVNNTRSFFYKRLINTNTQCPLISWVEADLDNMNKENIAFITNKRFIITIDNTIGNSDKRKVNEMIQNKQNSFFISFSEFFIDDLSNYIYIMKLIYTLKSHKFRFVGKVDNLGILVELTSIENTINKGI